jgi:hypothetical protein
MARLFAERGYHAVVQSTRGTFGSEGRIDFDREAATQAQSVHHYPSRPSAILLPVTGN